MYLRNFILLIFLTIFLNLNSKNITIISSDKSSIQGLKIPIEGELNLSLGNNILEVTSSNLNVATIKTGSLIPSNTKDTIIVKDFGHTIITIKPVGQDQIVKSFSVNIYKQSERNTNQFKDITIFNKLGDAQYVVNQAELDETYLKTFYTKNKFKSSESAFIYWDVDPKYAAQIYHTSQDSVSIFMKAPVLIKVNAYSSSDNKIIDSYYVKRDGNYFFNMYYDPPREKFSIMENYPKSVFFNKSNQIQYMTIGSNTTYSTYSKGSDTRVRPISKAVLDEEQHILNLGSMTLSLPPNDSVVIYDPSYINQVSFYNTINQDSINKNVISKLPKLYTMEQLFKDNTTLDSVPKEMFKQFPELRSLRDAFNSATNFNTVQEKLLAENKKLKNLVGCFYNLPQVTEIPDDIFPSSWTAENGIIKNNEGELVNFSYFIDIPSDPIRLSRLNEPPIGYEGYVYENPTSTLSRNITIKSKANTIAGVPEEITGNNYFQLLCQFGQSQSRIELANGDQYGWDGSEWSTEGIPFSFTNQTPSEIEIYVGASETHSYFIGAHQHELKVSEFDENYNITNKNELAIKLKSGETFEVYGAQKIASISNLKFQSTPSATLFRRCTGVKSFQSLLADNTIITTIPDQLFNRCTEVVNMDSIFFNSSLVSIPGSIFGTNIRIESFNSSFEASAIDQVNTGWFSTNLQAKSFKSTFKDCKAITTVPQDIFKENSLAENFESCFENCTQLAAIEEIFYENQAIKNLDYCFNNLTSLNQFNIAILKNLRMDGDNLENASGESVSIHNIFGDSTTSTQELSIGSMLDQTNPENDILKTKYFQALCQFGMKSNLLHHDMYTKYGFNKTSWAQYGEFNYTNRTDQTVKIKVAALKEFENNTVYSLSNEVDSYENLKHLVAVEFVTKEDYKDKLTSEIEIEIEAGETFKVYSARNIGAISELKIHNQAHMDELDFGQCRGVLSLYKLFYDQDNFESVEYYIVMNCTEAKSVASAFENCDNFKTVPEYIFSNIPQIIDYSNCFNNCPKIKEFPTSTLSSEMTITDKKLYVDEIEVDLTNYLGPLNEKKIIFRDKSISLKYVEEEFRDVEYFQKFCTFGVSNSRLLLDDYRYNIEDGTIAYFGFNNSNWSKDVPFVYVYKGSSANHEVYLSAFDTYDDYDNFELDFVPSDIVYTVSSQTYNYTTARPTIGGTYYTSANAKDILNSANKIVLQPNDTLIVYSGEVISSISHLHINDAAQMDTVLQKLPELENGYELFKNLDISNLNKGIFKNNPKLETATKMFMGSSNFTTTPDSLFATTSLQYADSLFYESNDLIEIKRIFAGAGDLRSVAYGFNGCSKLATVKDSLFIDNGEVTNFTRTFYQCPLLKEFPALTFSNNFTNSSVGNLVNSSNNAVVFTDFFTPPLAGELKLIVDDFSKVNHTIRNNQYFMDLCLFGGNEIRVEDANNKVYGHNANAYWSEENKFVYKNNTSSGVNVRATSFTSSTVNYKIGNSVGQIGQRDYNNTGMTYLQLETAPALYVAAGASLTIYSAQNVNGLTRLAINNQQDYEDLDFDNLVNLENAYQLFFDQDGITDISSNDKLVNKFEKLTKLRFVIEMFSDCRNIGTIVADPFHNNSAVENASYIFNECDNLKLSENCNLFSAFTNVTNYQRAFRLCSQLDLVPQGLFSASTKATNFTRAFVDCTNLKVIKPHIFATLENAANCEYMFSNCTSLNEVHYDALSDAHIYTDFAYAFEQCANLVYFPAECFPISNNNSDDVTMYGTEFLNSTDHGKYERTFMQTGIRYIVSKSDQDPGINRSTRVNPAIKTETLSSGATWKLDQSVPPAEANSVLPTKDSEQILITQGTAYKVYGWGYHDLPDSRTQKYIKAENDYVKSDFPNIPSHLQIN